jgi:hypothetical protein
MPRELMKLIQLCKIVSPVAQQVVLSSTDEGAEKDTDKGEEEDGGLAGGSLNQ